MDQISNLPQPPLLPMPQSSQRSLEESELKETLLAQGELSIFRGDLKKGMELFDAASQLDPTNAQLFLSQGISLSDYGKEQGKDKSLLLATKKFKKAVSLNPQLFEAWLAWGDTLFHLGLKTEQHHYFLKAVDTYRKAIAHAHSQPNNILAELYWDYGKVWHCIGKHSGEALDFQLALNAFQKAATYLDSMPSDYWNDMGSTYLQISKQLNDSRSCAKAINCFKHALSLAPSSGDAWNLLAVAMHRLYSFSHDEEHFKQANDCFASAARLTPDDLDLWINWAQFLIESARHTYDVKHMRGCIEKCQRAYAIDDENATALALWAEGLALLGEIAERLDLINDALDKVEQAAELDPDDPAICHSYGLCLRSAGNYFNDFDYYYQAIEKFQHGVSIDRTRHHLWHAMAVTYTIVGTLDEDIEAFELACRFYLKAIDLYPSTYYLFDYASTLGKIGEITHQQNCLEQALVLFERAFSVQKNALYIHPDWLFHYAIALDNLGEFHEEESYYVRALEILSHVAMVEPDFPHIHHRLGLVYTHLGELTSESDHFLRAIHHFRLAAKHEEENDQVLLDWAIALLNIAQRSSERYEADPLYRDAEQKLIQAATLGNMQSYYQLGCLYSILGQYEKAMRYIYKSDENKVLPPIDELVNDDWLDGLRATTDFREFLAQLEKRPHLQEER